MHGCATLETKLRLLGKNEATARCGNTTCTSRRQDGAIYTLHIWIGGLLDNNMPIIHYLSLSMATPYLWVFNKMILTL